MADPSKISQSTKDAVTWSTDQTSLQPGQPRTVEPIWRSFFNVVTWADAVHDLLYAATTGIRDKVAALESAERDISAKSLTASGEVQAEHLHSTDDLEVADDATIGGDLAVTGASTLSGNLTINGQSLVMPNVVKFRAVRGTNQSITKNTNVTVIYDDATAGSDGFNTAVGGADVYNTTTGIFTVPANMGGLYQFSWGLCSGNLTWSSGDIMVAKLRVDTGGTVRTVQRGFRDTAHSSETRLMSSGGTALVKLLAGDKVSIAVEMSRNDNGTLNPSIEYNFFSGMRVA